MKVSIIIPQLFYDLIARILPGILFLILIIVYFPAIQQQIEITNYIGEENLFESLGYAILFSIISYFLGWFFSAFTHSPKKKGSKIELSTKDEFTNKDLLNRRYQWIRLNNPEAGFRIVKLRAEARMLEATHIAVIFFAAILLSDIIFEIIYFGAVPFTNSITCLIKYIVGILISIFAYIGCFILEKKVWRSYWGNIDIIYDILHDKNDPVIREKE